jgi:hypothetical protein
LKKYIAIVAAILFVLGFTASAFAIHAEIPAETQAVVAKGETQITLGGQLRVRGFYQNNTDFDDDSPDEVKTLEQRVRLSLDAKVSPNLQGFVELRDTKVKGDDDQTWGVNGNYDDSSGIYRKGGEPLGTDETNLAFIQAWILYKWALGDTPMGLKVGHMPLKLGRGLFYSHTKNGEDGLVVFADPSKQVHMAFVYAKFEEGSSTEQKDADAYVLLANYSGKSFNIGGDLTYAIDKSGDIYTDRLDLYNLGVRGDVKFGAVKLWGDVELQSGQGKNDVLDDDDFSGFAAIGGADFKVSDMTLGLHFGYGSGDDDPADNDVKTFITVLDNTKNDYMPWIYDYRAIGSNGVKQVGISNTTYVKARINSKVTKALSVQLDGYWLQATETASGVDDELGYEVDWKVKYKLAKNLLYYVEGGYLSAGDFYKQFTPAGDDPDNPWAVRHGLILSF